MKQLSGNGHSVFLSVYYQETECIIYYHSCCKKGFAMGSMPSTGQTSTTAVPRQTAKPSCLVSSVSLNGSSGSTSQKYNHECDVHRDQFSKFSAVSMTISMVRSRSSHSWQSQGQSPNGFWSAVGHWEETGGLGKIWDSNQLRPLVTLTQRTNK